MRRKYLFDEELNRVIRLKQAGASWLKIQEKTGVPRRSAKRAYEDWDRDKSLEELKAARVQVATEAFREHLGCIVQVAEVFVNNLPESMVFDETRDAEKVLSDIWMRDIPGKYELLVPFRSKTEREQQRIVRQNEMLFQSLKDHTREKVRWQVLEEWGQNWNACKVIFAKIREKSKKNVLSDLDDRESNLKDRIKEVSAKKDVIENMIRGVVEAGWLGILAGKPEESYNLIRTIVVAGGTNQVLFGDKASLAVIELDDSNLAEDIAILCKLETQNLFRGDLVKQANDTIHTIGTQAKELEVMLNPLILRPMILRTRCELCPA